MIYQPHFLYRLKLIFVFLVVKLKFLHPLLPKRLRTELPIGWNNYMFWVAFKSGGSKIFFDYYSKLREPLSYELKAVVAPEYRLTEEDIRFFHENGYIGPFDLIPSDEVKGIQEHLVNLVTHTESKVHAYSQGNYEFERDENGTDKNEESYKIINSANRHLEDSVLRNLFKNPAITERCAQLLGPDVILWRSVFFNLPPFGDGVGWHQANTWLGDNLKESVVQPPDFEEIFQLTCWIALTDAYKENGCMALIPGSHREIYPTKFDLGMNNETSEKYKRAYGIFDGNLDYSVDPQKVKYIEMKAGQFYLFTERLVHGSIDNVTNNSRWAVNARITRTDVKLFTEKMLKEQHETVFLGVKKMKLDNWKALLIRGEDRFGYNRLFEE